MGCVQDLDVVMVPNVCFLLDKALVLYQWHHFVFRYLNEREITSSFCYLLVDYNSDID